MYEGSSRIIVTLMMSFFIVIDYYPQQDSDEFYLNGIYALKNADTASAYNYFLKSIKENDNPASYFNLAKLSIASKDPLKRMNILQYFKAAVEYEPSNIQYRFDYAQYLENISKPDRSIGINRRLAFAEYEKIIKIEPNSSPAYFHLGCIKYQDYIEFNRSYQKLTKVPFLKHGELSAERRREFIRKQWEDSFEPLLEYKMYAQRDFEEAENYLKTSIKTDSANYDAYKLLAKLYEEANKNMEGIYVLKKLILQKKADSETYLYCGLLYYKETYMKESYKSFNKAIELMPSEQKEDFTVKSVFQIINTEYIEKLRDISDTEMRRFIVNYWNSKDPLVLTDYNERLLEHYARVTYANMRFTIESKKVKGWQTDRGEILLRYGFPLKRIKLRSWSEISNSIDKMKPLQNIYPETEIWFYTDFTLGFADPYRTNEYKFNIPELEGSFNTQFAYDTQLFVEGGLRKTKPEEYYPKFEGPIFNLTYQEYQFASKNKSQTDIYLSYEINFNDTYSSKEKFLDGYNVGLFMFDNNFNIVFENKNAVTTIDNESNFVVNTLEMTTIPLSGNLAFEMLRNKDRGVTAYHGKYSVRDFSNKELSISDIVLASNIETDKEHKGGFMRKNISILPNPSKILNKNDRIFLYYEVYNLEIGKDKLTEFEQELTIKKVSDETIVNKLLDAVGLGSKGEKISMKSNFQTLEKDSQIYFQLGMDKYDSGEYEIRITIKDNTIKKEVSSTLKFNWIN